MTSFQLELKEIQVKDPHIEFIINDYWNVPDDKFEELERNTYNKLKNGEIHFAWYFRAYQTYEFFTRKGIIPKAKMDIKQEFMEGLKKAAERGPYTEYTYTMFLKEENCDEKNLNEFEEKINKINDGWKVKREKKDAQFLFELMRTDFNGFSIKMNENHMHMYIPFFAYCDPEEFCAIIINLSADDINTIRGFIKQRNDLVYENHYSNLQMELPNLKKIKCELNDEIKLRTKTPRLVLIEYLVEEIERFENKVNRLNSAIQSTL